MKILHLCNKKYYDTKMSRVRFHSLEALSKITFVKMSGIGYNNYDNELSVQENIDNFDIHFDLVIAYKPGEMKDFGKINIPKCIRYNEMFDIDETLKEIEKNNIDLVICHHLNEMKYYKSFKKAKFVQIPHSANKNIFKKIDNLDKKTDFLLVGSIWDRYPLRQRIQKIFKQLEQKYICKVFQHPGYELNEAFNDNHLKEFVKEINLAKIAITCSGKYKCRYGKLVEVPMCGTPLACDMPDEEQEHFSKFLINIDHNQTDEEIIETLESHLNSEYLLNKKSKYGLDWSKLYTQELYAERLLKEIKTFLNKDIQLEQNIQSLWIGENLTNMEILSMKSFIQNGHNYHLYTYQPIKNVPDGVLIKDANEILPEKDIFRYENGSVSAFSNVFRYKLLFDKGGYWVDTDLVCIKPFDFKSDYVFGTEPWDNYTTSKLNPCIMKAPRLSVPMYEGYNYCLSKKQDVLDGKIQWDLGPSSLLHIVQNLNLFEYIRDWRVFNLYQSQDWYAPLINLKKIKQFFNDQNLDIKLNFETELDNLDEKTYAIHLYNEVWRNIPNMDKKMKYEDSCLFERLKTKYNVKNNTMYEMQLNVFKDGNNLGFNITKEHIE